MGLEIRLRDSPTYLNLKLHEQAVELTLPGAASPTLCGLVGPRVSAEPAGQTGQR
ncbi:MAG: hypothetical protein M3N32_09205 [Actinomycetota bacterium]|nr:hypothetical protein [Actinomycetota bacterium]